MKGVLERVWGGVTASPYPWWYTAAYPYFARRPSLRNRTGLRPAATAGRYGGGAAARLVFFGDLFDLPAAPSVDPRVSAIFAGADLVLGNLEGPVLEGPGGGPWWSKRIGAGYLEAVLAALGAAPSRTVLSVANNHAQDAGDAGLGSTLACLRRLGVAPAGAIVDGRPLGCRRVLEGSGLAIEVAAWTEWLNRPPGGGFSAPDRFGVARRPPLDPGAADARVALPHWDYEYQHFPARRTRALARRLASAGFDAVAGAHQHVIQPLEILGGCHVLYGAGNFLHGGREPAGSPAGRLGALWEVELAAEGPSRGRVCAYRVTPFLHDRQRNRLALVEPHDHQALALFRDVHHGDPPWPRP
ncbi:MAG TPA: CapA family protein [Polyangiaceae bacterium]|nr:CapA family protein [Polyangiaceae bacterium]